MMKPGVLMVFGATMGIALALVSVLLPGVVTPATTMYIFAFGALFGKGYGVWEERSRRRS